VGVIEFVESEGYPSGDAVEVDGNGWDRRDVLKRVGRGGSERCAYVAERGILDDG